MGKMFPSFSTWQAANTKANKKSSPIRTTAAQPTGTVGKGQKKSSKSGVHVPNNSNNSSPGKPHKLDNRGKNADNTPKNVAQVGKVSTTTHSARHLGRNTKNAGFKSNRVNHSLLKRAK